MEEVLKQYGGVLLAAIVAACLLTLFCTVDFTEHQNTNLIQVIGEKLVEGGL